MSGALSSWKVRVGGTVLVLFLSIAAFGPILLDALGLDPHSIDRAALRQPPSVEHWLGTDSSGSDLFAQWILGARGSVLVGISAGLIMTAIAVVVGLIAGFAGGWLDSTLNSTINLLMVIPAIPLAIIVAGYMGTVNEVAIVLIIGLVGWPGEARAVRSQVLSLRNRDFVTASRMVGESRTRQLFVDVLPHMSGYIFNLLLVAIVGAVFAEASLRFLGIGSPDISSWGTMLELSRTQGAILSGMWWWYLPPGLGIALLGAAAALLNFGFDEMVNPRLRAARPQTRKRVIAANVTATRQRAVLSTSTRDDTVAHHRPLLDVRDLDVDYITDQGSVAACRQVNLTIRQGEIVGVVGESGSGKSTLAHAILRLIRPPGVVTGGQVLWSTREGNQVDLLSIDSNALQKLRWSDFSIVLQSAMDALNPVTRLNSQFADVIRQKEPGLSKAVVARRTADLLSAVRIPQDKARSYPHELSGGMRQRAAIALALACGPRLVVMDEATTAVDVVVQRQIIDHVLRLREELGFAVMFVTHDLALLLEIADTVVVMKDGVVVETADVETIGDFRSDAYTQKLFQSFPSALARRTSESTTIASTREPILVADNLGKDYAVSDGFAGRTTAAVVQDASLSLYPGEIHALVGESGSGKSTLARMLGLVIPPSRGELVIDGEAAPRRRAPRRLLRRVQILFQDPFGSLNRLQTLRYILGRPLRIHGFARSRAQVVDGVSQLLKTVNLNPVESYMARRPDELSGGQRQRVVIARALASNPDVVLADEPVSMLDVSIRLEVLDLLRKLSDERQVAMLYVTHDIASARYISDKISVMYAGRIVENGSVSDVMDRPLHPYSRLLIDATPEAAAPGDRRAVQSIARDSVVGEPPARIRPSDGCPFEPRCPAATAICREESPPKVHSGQQWAECWNPLRDAVPEEDAVLLTMAAAEESPS